DRGRTARRGRAALRVLRRGGEAERRARRDRQLPPHDGGRAGGRRPRNDPPGQQEALLKLWLGGEQVFCSMVRSVFVFFPAGAWRLLAACLCLALASCVSSCGGGQQSKTFDDVEGAGGAPVKQGVKPEPDAEAAVIETDYGRIVVELYPNVAPKMVE